MATSLGQESSCSTTTFLNISATTDESNGRHGFGYAPCPACNKVRYPLVCPNCVNFGKSTKYQDSLFEKKKKLREFRSQGKINELGCQHELRKRNRATQLEEKILHKRCAIQTVRLLLRENMAALDEERARLVRTERETSNAAIQLERMKEFVLQRNNSGVAAESSAAAASPDHLDELRRRLEEKRLAIRDAARRGVRQVMETVFPIAEVVQVPPKKKNKTSSGAGARSLTSEELEDAARTTYVGGRWLRVGADDQQQRYRIVEPQLPGNGDYSAYRTWIDACGGTAPVTEGEMAVSRRSAYGIVAGLTLAAHLVSALSFYLDLHLPKQLCYSEFSKNDLNKDLFAYKVAKLNCNVLHLCLAQGVDPARLGAKRTLANLALLADPTVADIGRTSPPADEVLSGGGVDSVLLLRSDSLVLGADATTMDDASTARDDDDELTRSGGDGGGDSDDDFQNEWEELSADKYPLHAHEQHVRSLAPASGGLVASAAATMASWWRTGFGK